MKKLITLLAIVLFISCDKIPLKKINYKYKSGDIVYLKLDGKKVMIKGRATGIDTVPYYEIYYKSDDGEYTCGYLQEFCLTNKKGL